MNTYNFGYDHEYTLELRGYSPREVMCVLVGLLSSERMMTALGLCGRIVQNNTLLETLVFHYTLSTLKVS
jgi:hypothetical protein